MTQAKEKTIKEAVKDRYGSLARKASQEQPASCCGSDTSGGATSPYDSDTWTPDKIYSQSEIDVLPDTVTAASAGCGNPTALTELKSGETMLDLGSGGGIDCFLAREQVGHRRPCHRPGHDHRYDQPSPQQRPETRLRQRRVPAGRNGEHARR